MNLHEYQSKELFEKRGLPLLRRYLLKEKAQLKEVREFFAAEKKIVSKVQIHAGGRGKVGGVKVLDNAQEPLNDFIEQFLGKKVQTHQTSGDGQPVTALLFEEPCQIQQEFYLSLVMNREKKCLDVLACAQGGIHIEEEGHIVHFSILSQQVLSHHVYNLLSIYQLDKSYFEQVKKILEELVWIFKHYDASLIEINPLVLDDQGLLKILDAKMTMDDNALYRHKELASDYDTTQDDPKEIKAKAADLSYVALEGEIGCLVNGAGLAMATMDLIYYCGGRPANFLDVGGTATEERVGAAVEIILQDPQVKVIFINIFGGIVRCDIIARGILAALKRLSQKVHFVVRLQGNESALAKSILETSGLDIIVEEDFLSAAKRAVQLAQEAS